MPPPRTWPTVRGEFRLSDAEATQVGRHVRWCPNPNCGWRAVLDAHVAALFADGALQDCAERYYRAAGFRE